LSQDFKKCQGVKGFFLGLKRDVVCLLDRLSDPSVVEKVISGKGKTAGLTKVLTAGEKLVHLLNSVSSGKKRESVQFWKSMPGLVAKMLDGLAVLDLTSTGCNIKRLMRDLKTLGRSRPGVPKGLRVVVVKG